MQKPFDKKKIYLDYAATTPVDPRVIEKMLPYFSKKFGNPASMHALGQEAKKNLEESRGYMAETINADSEELIFTGSATESNNMSLKGVAWLNKDKGKHILVSPIEHACVRASANWLLKKGFDVEFLSVDNYGKVSPEEVKNKLRKDTLLVSVMHASNEFGTIEPIREIGAICRENKTYFHTDAVQSFGKEKIDVREMNIDLLSASSHKIYGPKGVAFLYIRKGVGITPLLHGGGQEFGLRSATINLSGIVGFTEAVRIYQKEGEDEGKRLAGLRNRLIEGIKKNVEEAHLNGHPEERIYNNANFWFKAIEGEAILIQLDFENICVSTGSACASAKLEASPTLLAIGLRPEQAHSSIRFTLGRWTTEEEIDHVVEILPKTISKLREISPFKTKK